ncbi:MerR family transcriptional regulator [Candidatus Gottesmanbacteria bacterium]|nr:MerR family transcriptional regulator [Candidatus Gottesmanbacteria bacterium]
MDISNTKPLFSLSVVSKITNLPAKTLNYFERQGLIAPSKTPGNRRLYSKEDLIRVLTIKYLKEKMALNSSGINLILKITSYTATKGVNIKEIFFKDLDEEKDLKEALNG